MNTGILWWDNATNKTLAQKVQEAAKYFRHRYERIPELCLVNPKMIDLSIGKEGEVNVDGIKVTVRPWHAVVIDHLWIGVEDAAELIKQKAESPV